MGWSSGLTPEFAPYAEWFVKQLESAGLRPQITSVRRSTAKQAALYRAYITGKSRLPAAKPGTSKHERGLAFDLVIPSLQGLSVKEMTKRMQPIGQLWEAIGGRWGGRFNDPVHFEV